MGIIAKQRLMHRASRPPTGRSPSCIMEINDIDMIHSIFGGVLFSFFHMRVSPEGWGFTLETILRKKVTYDSTFGMSCHDEPNRVILVILT